MSLTPIEPGDRVEFPSYEIVNTEIEHRPRGTVIDVIRGEAGRAEMIVSRPEGAPEGAFRVDFIIVGAPQPSVRPVTA